MSEFKYLFDKLSITTKLGILVSIIFTPLIIYFYYVNLINTTLEYIFWIFFFLFFIFYLFGISITEILVIFKKIKYDEDRKLKFWDWYSHVRVISFRWWFNIFFLLYVLIKGLASWNKEIDFRKDRFYIESYIFGVISIIIFIIVIITIISSIVNLFSA